MSTDQPGSAQTNGTVAGMSLPTVAVVAVCALSGLVLAAVVALLALGKPIDTLMTVVGTLVVPTIVALLGVKKLNDFQPVIHDIALKVNGRLDGALTTIKALEAQVLASGGTPVTSPVVITAATPVLIPSPQHSAENPPHDVITPIPAQEVVANNG